MTSVALRIYDLSQGMARTMSQAIIGKQLDGIWHTGVVVFDREYYFGGGICSDPPGSTPYGTPYKIEQMGTTDKSLSEFLDFLRSVSNRFTMTSYHLLNNNCNNFSNECCQFLLGKGIPDYILNLPTEAANSPLGPVIVPLIENMQSAILQQSAGHELALPQNASSRAAPAASSISTPSPPASSSASQTYWASPVTLAKGDRKVITSKLLQFAPEYKQEPEELIKLSLSISPAKAFPALDLLRLHVADSEAIAINFATEYSALANRFILSEESPPPACMMTLRGAVNCFKYQSSSRKLVEPDMIETVVESIATGLLKEKPQIRKTAALLALNLAGAPRRHVSIEKLNEDHSVRLLFAIVERLNSNERLHLDEARPLLSALIVLVDGDSDGLVLVKTFGLDLAGYQNAESCEDELTRTAASQLAKMLASE